MADYADNYLKINGTNEQIEKVLEFVKPKVNKKKIQYDSKFLRNTKELADYMSFQLSILNDHVFCFECIIPIPYNEIKASDENESNLELSDWAKKNWGARFIYNSMKDDVNRIFFQTPNVGVPMVIESLSKEFPMVRFEYIWHEWLYGDGYEFEFQNGACLKYNKIYV